jgi:hypothetical protein
MARGGGWPTRAALAAMGLAAMGLVMIGLSACSVQTRPLGDPGRWSQEDCLGTFTVDHRDSPLAELRQLGGVRDDFQQRFPAALIDPAVQRPVSAVQSLRIDGRPIAWFSASLDTVMLDGAAFAPLRQADATRAKPGERLRVGRVTGQAREALGPRGVIELLVRVGAIQTYWHLGADLCLSEEHIEGKVYRARLRGVHHYADRREQQARYTFEVEINAHDEVVVTGVLEHP